MARGLTWRDMLRVSKTASADVGPLAGRDPKSTACGELFTGIPAGGRDRRPPRPVEVTPGIWLFNVVDAGWYMSYSLIAKGDFDGDGIADLLLRSQFGPGPNEGSEVTIDILTRRSPDGLLETPEWHPFRCFPPHGRSFFYEFLKGQEYEDTGRAWPYHPERDPPRD